ncbi:Serine protease, subtilisin family [Nitrosospira multiformis]|uniref:Serine protease, subtilisin family n=1 Tax=Nitrosospira multiformis TaxID=1231 RepID=A0A1H9Z5P6_9PROT|nr:S8 family serine peptidase [Nitrosospira multiformis]SES76822.1 Serine protease, subtilisin family [Nitrosospira multiformis]
MNINYKALATGSREPASEQLASGIIQSSTRNSQSIRKSWYSVFGSVLGVFLGLAPVISSAEPPEGRGPGVNKPLGWAKGRILVMPRAGLPEKELAKILGEHGGKGRKIGQSDLYIVDLPGNASEKAVAARLAHHPAFKFAEIDQEVEPALVPNDPYYGSAWHLPKIGAPSAWDSSLGSGVIIAILDSGVDPNHPDLSPQLVPGWNFYENNSNTSDVYGHGTKVAGSAAAMANNAQGVAGVAALAKIMPVRVSASNGYATWSAISQGLIYAADRGVRVANASFLGLTDSSSTRSAAQYMKDKGGLVIVSGGNTGVLQNYAVTTSMVAVAATDSNDFRASWSSYGNYISLAAPGAGIWTTTMGGSYGAVSGTSFSSPVTAGVVALMMAAKPALPNTQIESLLFSTAVDLGTTGRDPYYGYGRVDAARAVQAAASAVVAGDTQAPVVSITSPAGGSSVTSLVGVNVTATDNVGVTRVELRVNSTTIAVDTTAPFAFTWDSAGVANGMASLVAYAFDAAGNSKASTAVSVNVANGTTTVIRDTTAPQVKIINPVGGNVSGNNVPISVNASDDSGASGINYTLYIDGVLKATGKGSTLGYNWNIRSVAAGAHTVQVVAKDAAGNSASSSITVTVVK